MFDNPSEGRKTFQSLCELTTAPIWLQSSLLDVSAHNVLNMLNGCTKCGHLAFCTQPSGGYE